MPKLSSIEETMALYYFCFSSFLKKQTLFVYSTHQVFIINFLCVLCVYFSQVSENKYE